MPDNRFKPYYQHQLRLLPLDLSEMIPDNHVVRVVDSVVESLDLTTLKSFYPGGGAPAYDPRMMLKVVIFAYATGIYSSRKISEATKSNIYFMWLTNSTSIDHMTINRFRTERLRSSFEEVFAQSVELLSQLGLVSLDTYFLDGTKIEANANKYTFTWKRSVEKNQAKLKINVGRMLDEIDALNDAEDALFDDMHNPNDISSEDIAEVAARINARLKEKAEQAKRDKALEKAKKKIESDYLPRMLRYEKDLSDIASRNSLSKTDRDATFMRMKEDHMRNGQLKAAYNIQNGTENQFVVHTSIHQRPGDTACLIPHLESLKHIFGYLPGAIVADSGYGSEQNYEYLEDKHVQAFVKYGYFHKEQKRSFKKDPTQVLNWHYDENLDQYICSYGKTLTFLYESHRTSDLGYKSTYRVYGATECKGCPHNRKCLKGKSENRRININPHLESYKAKARELLTSAEGVNLRKRRATDVETVFGDVKRNWGFKRFTLRGLEKVSHEWKLVMMGHNIRKLTQAIKASSLPASEILGWNRVVT